MTLFDDIAALLDRFVMDPMKKWLGINWLVDRWCNLFDVPD